MESNLKTMDLSLDGLPVYRNYSGQTQIEAGCLFYFEWVQTTLWRTQVYARVCVLGVPNGVYYTGNRFTSWSYFFFWSFPIPHDWLKCQCGIPTRVQYGPNQTVDMGVPLVSFCRVMQPPKTTLPDSFPQVRMKEKINTVKPCVDNRAWILIHKHWLYSILDSFSITLFIFYFLLWLSTCWIEPISVLVVVDLITAPVTSFISAQKMAHLQQTHYATYKNKCNMNKSAIFQF